MVTEGGRKQEGEMGEEGKKGGKEEERQRIGQKMSLEVQTTGIKNKGRKTCNWTEEELMGKSINASSFQSKWEKANGFRE